MRPEVDVFDFGVADGMLRQLTAGIDKKGYRYDSGSYQEVALV